MIDFERILKRGEHLEKIIRWLTIIVFVAIVFAWIGQVFIAAYFVDNPAILSSWIGELIEGFNQ